MWVKISLKMEMLGYARNILFLVAFSFRALTQPTRKFSFFPVAGRDRRNLLPKGKNPFRLRPFSEMWVKMSRHGTWLEIRVHTFSIHIGRMKMIR